MKKSLVLFVMISTCLAGCLGVELEENPSSLVAPETFYKTEADLRAALTGVFNPLFSKWEDFSSYGPIVLTGGGEDIRADAGIFNDPDKFRMSGGDFSVNIVWPFLYQSISNANILIDKLTETQGIPQNTLNEIEGQAKFIRALSYFFLTRFWGEVQLTTAENQTNVDVLPQASVQEIYDAVVSDLTDAENLLPLSFSERGRPNKVAATALLSKVYLTMAGWPLEKIEYYALARDKANALINGEFAGKYRLEDNFVDLWEGSTRVTNDEFIFAFYGTIAPGGTPSRLQKTTSAAGFGENGWESVYSEHRFFDAFPEGPRKDASFTMIMNDGTPWEETGSFPLINKYRDVGETINANGEGVTVLLRYADILLIYAEAANLAEGGPSQTAYDAVNAVRRRAGLDDLASGMSQLDFDKAVLDERNWELAFELNRWFDLVRRKMVVDVNKDLYPHVNENNRLLPKPTTQLVPGILDQNPGY